MIRSSIFSIGHVFLSYCSKEDIVRNKLIGKLVYRSRNRGTKEACIIYEKFSQTHVKHLNDEDLKNYDLLLKDENINENDLIYWIYNPINAPQQYQTILEKIKSSVVQTNIS